MTFILAFMVVFSVPLTLMGTQMTQIPGPADHCIAESKYTKDAPSPETLEFCQIWESNSCCTAETTRRIRDTGYLDLYNFRWDLCGNLSSECRRFIQVCTYLCLCIINDVASYIEECACAWGHAYNSCS